MRLKGFHQGKSGGYRLYVFIIEIGRTLSPLVIYSKNEKQTIKPEQLMWHLNQVLAEIKDML